MKKLSIFIVAFLVASLCPLGSLFASDGPSIRVKKDTYFAYTGAYWCFTSSGPNDSTADYLTRCTRLGLMADLVPFSEWDSVNIKMGSVLPEMGKDKDGNEIFPFVPGFNDPDNEDRVRGAINTALDKAKTFGSKYVLVFTGMDSGDVKDLQYKRIVRGFRDRKLPDGKSLIDKAEALDVTLIIEMLNSKGDPNTWKGHPGYLGDDTVQVMDRIVIPVASSHFKAAYDIYHVAMMGEDPVKLARKYGKHIGYVHVAGMMKQRKGKKGVPHPWNRGELHLKGQKIDYPNVMLEISKVVERGTPACLEYIPNEEVSAKVDADILRAISLCESKIK